MHYLRKSYKGTKALVFIDFRVMALKKLRGEVISSFFFLLMTTPYIFPQTYVALQLTNPLGMKALCKASALLKHSSIINHIDEAKSLIAR